MHRSLSDNQLYPITTPRIVITPPEEVEMGLTRPRSQSDISQLPDNLRQEVLQWAVNELLEQNREHEENSRCYKATIACLGTITATLSVAVGITELIKAFGN